MTKGDRNGTWHCARCNVTYTGPSLSTKWFCKWVGVKWILLCPGCTKAVLDFITENPK